MKLTVLMAVRNGEPFLNVAVESILRQTYEDFRFLIIDDASTDRTREIIRSYRDQRIDLLCLENNVGQTAALSLGVQRVSTPWIARMDADDFSAPTRFEEQVRLLKEDSSLGCVGTFAWVFRQDPSAAESIIVRPESHRDIQRALLWDAPIIHGSIIVSKEVFLQAGGYNDKYRYCADLDLYDRLIDHCKTANIPRPLLGLRRHDGQGSHSPVAVEEGIEIYKRRLASGRYSADEIKVLQGALSLWFVRRGLVSLSKRKPATILSSALRAMTLSPATVLRFSLSQEWGRRYSFKTWKMGERPVQPNDTIDVAVSSLPRGVNANIGSRGAF
jgi:glycosyltransferase involved in cell wall biosynthesis